MLQTCNKIIVLILTPTLEKEDLILNLKDEKLVLRANFWGWQISVDSRYTYSVLQIFLTITQ